MSSCVGDSGDRLAFGHYYLRPHETFHEPTRRFFHCELFRVPLYDLVPLDAVVGLCCIMDLHTYCRVCLNPHSCLNIHVHSYNTNPEPS